MNSVLPRDHDPQNAVGDVLGSETAQWFDDPGQSLGSWFGIYQGNITQIIGALCVTCFKYFNRGFSRLNASLRQTVARKLRLVQEPCTPLGIACNYTWTDDGRYPVH